MRVRDVIVVVQKDDHSLGFFDFASGAELRRVPIPRYPHEFAISADGRYAFSCHFGLKLAEDDGPGGSEVSVVDLATGIHVRSIDCNGWRRPHGIAVDHAGSLYVLSEGAGRLLVVPDPSVGTIARTFPTFGKGSHIVAVTPDGSRAYCSNMFSGTVSVLFLDGESDPLVLDVGDRPEGSAFDADARRLLVCNRESSNIAIIDVAKNAITGRIDTPPGPVRIVHWRNSQFGVALYHDQSIVVVDADTCAVVNRTPLPHKPVSIGLDRNRTLCLAGMLPSGLAVVDPAAAHLLRVIPTREGPDPMVVLPLAM